MIGCLIRVLFRFSYGLFLCIGRLFLAAINLNEPLIGWVWLLFKHGEINSVLELVDLREGAS